MSEKLTDSIEERPCPHCGVIIRRPKPVNLIDAYEIERLRAAIAREVLRIDAGCDNLRAALAESSHE